MTSKTFFLVSIPRLTKTTTHHQCTHYKISTAFTHTAYDARDNGWSRLSGESPRVRRPTDRFNQNQPINHGDTDTTPLTFADRFSDRVAALENFVLVNDVVEVLIIHPMVVNASLSRRRRFSGPRPAPLNLNLLLLTRLLGVISAGSGQHRKLHKNTD